MADLSQSSWSETDANNNQTAPLGWTPGVMLPTQVEPTAQAMMGAMKRWWNRQNPTYAAILTTTDTYVVTPQTPVTSFTSFELWRVRMPSANVTTSPTITWGPSAATIQKYNNGALVNLALGDIQAQYYEFFFNNTVMVLTNPVPPSPVTPGGSSGQIQFNNNNAFGGLTVSGDATIASSGTLVFATTGVTASTYSLLNATLDAKGRVISASVSPLGTVLTNSLGSDTALNNVSNYFDGPSVAQGSTGIWYVSGTVTLNAPSQDQFNVKLWDGTTVIASAVVFSVNGPIAPVSLSGYLASPAANLRISVRDVSSVNGLIKFNSSGNSKDSTITAFRIG